MKVKKVTSKNGLLFYCRPDSSDEKTVEEVINKNVYERNGIEIQKGEKWIDLGGNIGSFTLLALSKGAEVETYEPDHTNYKILCENLKLNGYITNKVYNKAVVHDGRKNDYLHISKTNQHWRNSLVKSFNGDFREVECINFRDVIKNGYCVKMDIEGSEMHIIENFDITGVKKMVFEWSFDIDNNLDRYRNAIDNIKKYFSFVKYRSFGDSKFWKKSWVPPCVNVFCSN